MSQEMENRQPPDKEQRIANPVESGNPLSASLPSGRVDELITSLKHDANSRMRVIAAMALGNSGAEAAIPALSECLKDPDPEMREAAAGALALTQQS